MKSGLLNLLKPPGMTSHDVVSQVRKIYGLKKVGHAGTLDPAAAGVLPVALGQATRLLEYLAGEEKTYRVELTLGYETDTGDEQGTLLRQTDFVMPSVDRIKQILGGFCGTLSQIPPMHSAIKMNGQKLYELARKGIEIERKPRIISISNIQLLGLDANKFVFDVTCSKGTYIRSLCQDIGKALAIPAVMTFLLRTQVGLFQHNQAKTLEEIRQFPETALISPAPEHLPFPSVFVTPEQSVCLSFGQTLTLEHFEGQAQTGAQLVSVVNSDRKVLAIAKVSPSGLGWHIKPVKVLTCSEE